jgi:excisionase family DNA binding protein
VVRLLSPRALAEALGVSESSLKRWIDAGKLHAMRTEGRHRRISVPEAIRFARAIGAPVVRPEVLDLPEVTFGGPRDAASLRDLLIAGDARAVRGWVLARYLEGASVAELCDGPIRDAMYEIGERWRHQADGVFVEHRATDACLQALVHLRSTFDPPPDGPIAVGATPEDDPYILPSMMAAMVLGAAGFRSVNLGPDTPLAALAHAASALAPRIVWVSASAPLAPARARAIARWLAALRPPSTAVIGGRHSDRIAAARPRLTRLETMTELATFASKLLTARSPRRDR